MPAAPVLLASASPRRRKILAQLGIPFEVVVPAAEERAWPDDPWRTAAENARAKAAACRAAHADRRIIAADTVLDLDHRCIGKPASRPAAAACLRRLAGRAHRVLTGLAFADPGAPLRVQVVVSTVRFRPLTEGAIAAYLRQVDPLDKAGAYDIDDHGDILIESFEGSRTNIMGLPHAPVLAWLAPPHPLRIGNLVVDPPLVVAPMAGFSDSVFRRLGLACGAGVALTEVVNAPGIVRGSVRTLQLLDTAPDEQPVGAHIYGHEPEVLGAAAHRVEGLGRFAFVDLNAGCPVRRIVRRGAGAGLMADPARLAAGVRAMVANTTLPVTVKTRLGLAEDSVNILEIAAAVEEAGAQALFLHARCASRKHGGSADWDMLARVKAACRIPVVGNGGVYRPADTMRMIHATGVDGVMVGRAVIGNPWFFRDVQRLWRGEPEQGRSLAELRAMVEAHLAQLVCLKTRQHRDRKRVRVGAEHGAVRLFRPHLLRYLAGLYGWSDVRRGLNDMRCVADVMRAVDRVLERQKEH